MTDGKRTTLSLQQLGADSVWKVEAAPQELRFTPPRGPSERLAGQALADSIQITHSIAARPMLSVTLSQGRLVLVLTDDDVQTLTATAGKNLVTRAAVASNGMLDVAIGALIIFSSLQPQVDDPSTAALRWVWMAIGGLAIIIGIGAKLRPHRIWLALDSVWMAALVADTLHKVIALGESVWWLLFVGVLIPMANGRLKMFSLLAGPEPERAA